LRRPFVDSRIDTKEERAVEYILLIHTDENEWAALSDEARSAIIAEYFALTNEMSDEGVFVAGAPLQSTTNASRVRVRDDELLVTDGPFAETKEQVGGYILIEVESDEEARRWAAKIPAARYGTIEVRAVLPVGNEAGAVS
jgi:hypothetical protein